MELYIRLNKKKIHILKVSKEDTVKELKLKLKQETGILLETQRLKFKEDELKDESVLSELEIPKSSILELSQEVYFKTEDDGLKSMHVEVFKTIEEFKKLVDEKHSLPAEKYSLVYKGKKLVDMNTFEDYKIENCETLDYVAKGAEEEKACDNSLDEYDSLIEEEDEITLFVYANDVVAPIKVKPEITVMHFKELIKKNVQVPLKVFSLIIGTKNLEEEKKLEDYKVKQGDEVKCIEAEFVNKKKEGIFIRRENEERAFIQIKLDETVKVLKKKIEEQLKVPVNEQILIFEFHGERLEDSCTLKECEIRFGDTVDLEGCDQEGMDIVVKKLDGKIFAIKVLSSDPVPKIKQKISEKTGVKVGELRLIYCGKALEDNRTAGDYNMQNGNTIHITVRMKGGLSISSFQLKGCHLNN